MGAVVSLIVVAIGAILRFATSYQSSTWNIRTIGDILMIVGIVGLILSIVSFMYWDGFGVGGVSRRRRTTIVREPGEPIHGPDGYARTTYGDHSYHSATAANGVYGQAGANGYYDNIVDPTSRVGTVVEEERSAY